MITDESDNPYAPPAVAEVGAAESERGICAYADLPKTCPRCGRRFGEILYRQRYPRRYRWSTIAFFVALAPVAIVLSPFLTPWGGIFVACSLAAWAMRWPKQVRVYCILCGWSEIFVVRSTN
jgi:hypothetical protein